MIIYCATNKTNGMRYIGKTVKTLKARKQQHESSARKDSNLYFHNAIRKYGVEGFTWDVLYRSDNEAELNRMEINFIRMFRSADKEFGYNLTQGGDGCSPNEITRRKISERNKDAYASGRRVKRTGAKHPMFGKKHTEETKRKLSERQREDYASGKRAKLAGAKHPNFGKTGEEGHLFGRTGEKNSQFDPKIYAFYHPEHGIKHCTQHSLRKKHELDAAALSKLISGKCKSHKGWKLA